MDNNGAFMMEHVITNFRPNNSIILQPDYISQGSKFYDSFVNALKKLKEAISSNVKKIVVHEAEQSSTKLVFEIKESFESIEDILGKSPFYEEEYYTFSSIKDMAFYLLDDESLYIHLDIILDLISGFIDLVQIKKVDLEEYIDKQEEFSLVLSNHEQKFYTEICEPSEYYDEETLSKITNSLLDL